MVARFQWAWRLPRRSRRRDFVPRCWGRARRYLGGGDAVLCVLVFYPPGEAIFRPRLRPLSRAAEAKKRDVESAYSTWPRRQSPGPRLGGLFRCGRARRPKVDCYAVRRSQHHTGQHCGQCDGFQHLLGALRPHRSRLSSGGITAASKYRRLIDAITVIGRVCNIPRTAGKVSISAVFDRHGPGA